MVTDFDVWADRPVETAEILRTMQENVGRMGRLLATFLPTSAAVPTCRCADALENAMV